MNKYPTKNEYLTQDESEVSEEELKDYLDVLIQALMDGKVSKPYVRHELFKALSLALEGNEQLKFHLRWITKHCGVHRPCWPHQDAITKKEFNDYLDVLIQALRGGVSKYYIRHELLTMFVLALQGEKLELRFAHLVVPAVKARCSWPGHVRAIVEAAEKSANLVSLCGPGRSPVKKRRRKIKNKTRISPDRT
jgi:hypothetical protein